MENENTSNLSVFSQWTSTLNASPELPHYFSDLTPTLSLPPYPNRDLDPPPPEYYEIMRFNASSYAWTFPQHRLQSAMDEGDMSPLATATVVRNDMRRAEDQYTTSTMRSSERGLSPARQNSEEFNEEERARIDRALRRRMEGGDMAVRQHCRPIVYQTNSVGRLTSTLQRWTELLDIGDEDGKTGGIGSRKRSEVEMEVPGWIKARIEERKSHRSKRKMLSWFRKSRSYHV